MSASSIIEKIAKFLLNIFVTLCLSILSVIGMLVFFHSLIFVVFTFLFMAGIQWEVNKDGFTKAFAAFRNIFQPKRKLIEKFANKLLNQLLLKNELEKNSILEIFSKAKSKDIKDPTTIREEFIKYLAALTPTEINACITTLPPAEREFLNHLTRNKNLRPLAFTFILLLALAGGISYALASLSGISSALLILDIGFLTAVPFGVWIAIVAIGALGFAFLLYQTLSGIIEKCEDAGGVGNLLKKTFCRKVHKGQTESNGTYAARILGIIFAIIILGIATYATFGTWWLAAENGARQFTFISQKAASIIRSVFVIAMIIPVFVFGFVNSVEEVNELAKGRLASSLNNLWRRLCNQKWYDYINIFSWVAGILRYFLKVIIFITHVITNGFIGDKPDPMFAGNLNYPIFWLIFQSALDALIDLNYLHTFFPDGEEDAESEHEHGNRGVTSGEAESEKVDKKHLEKFGKHSHAHNHSHISLFVKYFIILPLSLPILVLDCLAAIFNWILTGFKSWDESWGHYFEVGVSKKPYSPIGNFVKIFFVCGQHHHHKHSEKVGDVDEDTYREVARLLGGIKGGEQQVGASTTQQQEPEPLQEPKMGTATNVVLDAVPPTSTSRSFCTQ
jgi:hypothetical protein